MDFLEKSTNLEASQQTKDKADEKDGRVGKLGYTVGLGMFGINEGVQEGAVHILNGKMGAGKTTNGAKEVLGFHKRGQPVWVNFPVSDYPDVKVKGERAPIYFEDDLSGILAMEGGLYVIDEAYMALNSRKWKDLPDKVFTAFRHVRKLHMTVIVLSQSWGDIDISVKRIASTVRMFEGGRMFGSMYPYTEYAIDENGEIIKGDPVEYISAVKGIRLIGKKTYGIFDTDFLFDSLREKRTWKSAVLTDTNCVERFAGLKCSPGNGNFLPASSS